MVKKQPLARYPWKKWFDKGRFTLKLHRDFRCTLQGMVAQVRMAAFRRGIRVHINCIMDRNFETEVIQVEVIKEKT